MTHVAVIIPALDEADVIGDVVARVPRGEVTDIIVVDNASTDATADVARAAGAHVVHETRRGYGAACWAGVNALGPGVAIAVFLDGDGSQDPRELPRLVDPVRARRADFVLGARQFGGGHPAHARLGTRVIAGLVARRYGIRLHDIGPFRAIAVPLLRQLALEDRAFGWPVEMVVKAAGHGARIVEVPVSDHPRAGGRSKVSGTLHGSVRAAYGFLRVAARAGLFSPTRPVRSAS